MGKRDLEREIISMANRESQAKSGLDARLRDKSQILLYNIFVETKNLPLRTWWKSFSWGKLRK